MAVRPRNEHQHLNSSISTSSSSSTSTLHPTNIGADPKRRKLSPEVYEVSSQAYDTGATLPSLPALLYHHAISAHHSSQRHLQQAFTPLSVRCSPSDSHPVALTNDGEKPRLFVHDAEAGAKALGLQLVALDLLRAGLTTNGLSDRERVAFGVEFGVVGLKVYQALHVDVGKGKAPQGPEINLVRLMEDVQDVVAQCYSIARRNSFLAPMRRQLEIINARLAFIQSKHAVGKRMIQQALAMNRDHPAQRYALYLLWLEYLEASPEFLSVVDDLSNEAQANEHTQIMQLTCLIKARYLFIRRRWELLPAILSNFATVINWSDDVEQIGHDAWSASVSMHFTFLRTLWAGRAGEDARAKVGMRKIYAAMDKTAERGLFSDLRDRGGVFQMDIPGSEMLLVQLTPPNILFMLVYLTAVVARRELVGSTAKCKNILHAQALRATEDCGRAEETWDIGFSAVHGLAIVQDLRLQTARIIGEIMLEQATALTFRSNPEESLELLLNTVDHFRKHDLFHPYSPHICLIFAQHAHLLGLDLSSRYYIACMSLINGGSELSLIAEIGLLGAQGGLAKLNQHSNMSRVDQVNALAEQCRLSTSATLNAAGQFLASLADDNRVNSKKKLSTAYEISQQSNNILLRGLIFAFTTSTHHYGGRDRMFAQLETGKEIAKLLGGKDRADGVGQVVLGLWCALGLKEFYRQEGNAEGAAEARRSVQAHVARLAELRALATAMRGKKRLR